MTQLRTFIEAFNNLKKEEGEIKFTKSTLQDPHIKKLIAYAAKETGTPVADIEKTIQKEIDEFKDIEKVAPILYHTIGDNIAEGEAFDLLKKVRIKEAPTFDEGIFNKLVRLIKFEHKMFFPLKNFIDHKSLHNPRFVLIPGENEADNKKYAKIKTAAATPKGVFIFNVKFMQELLDFGYVKGITPQGKKYKDHGGTIPNEYGYIEFLIIHELMHYSYADFHYQKILKGNGKIINWVGDFRTNYLLIKSGHDQLPIGLFNDKINYDRQDTYKEMYDLVKSEFDKLNKNQQKKVGKKIDGLTDDHDGDPGDPGPPPEENEGDPEGDEGDESADPDKDSKGTDGIDDSDDTGDAGGGDAEGKGDAKDGDAEGKGDAKDDDSDNVATRNGKVVTAKDIDDAAKETHRRSKRTGDVHAEDTSDKEIKGGTTSHAGARGGRGSKGVSGREKVDYSKIRPKMSWTELLKKMMKTETVEDESYQKPHRRSITGVHTAIETGAGAVKPGIIQTEAGRVKLCFVIDSSGSMGDSIAKIYANMANLFKTQYGAISPEFVVVKFSGDFKMYRCQISGRGVNGSYAEFRDAADLKKKPVKGEEGSIQKLFSEHFGSSTNFDSDLTDELHKLASQKYSIMILTDTDILAKGNVTEFVKLYAKWKSQVFLICNNLHSFHAIIEALKEVGSNISHM
jgi:predicted metal-dependent peptidase